MDKRKLRKGELLFREGDAADCMYVVSRGRIGVYAGYDSARPRLLKEYAEGEYFGEMGLIEHAPRSAAAAALEGGTCVEPVTEESFIRFFHERPDQVLVLIRQLSRNLRRTSADYAAVCRELQELAAKEDLT